MLASTFAFILLLGRCTRIVVLLLLNGVADRLVSEKLI
jgi:hypothetical protein